MNLEFIQFILIINNFYLLYMLVVLILVRVSLVKAAVLTTEFLEGTRVGSFQISLSHSPIASTSIGFTRAFTGQLFEIAFGLSGFSSISVNQPSKQIIGYSFSLANISKKGFQFVLTAYNNDISSIQYSFSFIASDNSIFPKILLANNIKIIQDTQKVPNPSIRQFNTQQVKPLIWSDSFSKTNIQTRIFFSLKASVDGLEVNISLQIENVRSLTVSLIILENGFLRTQEVFPITYSLNSASSSIVYSTYQLIIPGILGINASLLNFQCKINTDCLSKSQITVNRILLQICPQTCTYQPFRNRCMCYSCPITFFQQDGNCLRCSEDCQTCDINSTYCTSCKYGKNVLNGMCTCQVLFASQDATCISCNALQFQNYSICSCVAGFFKPSSMQECKPCLPHCLNCTNRETCVACHLGSYRDSSKNCSCLLGYYSAGQIICQPCPSFCLSCINNQSCKECVPGLHRSESSKCGCLDSFYDNGTDICLSCNIKCSTCRNLTNCLSCHFDSKRNASSNCSCYKGFYDNGSVVCVSCRPACAVCSSQSNCTKCKPSHTSYQNSSNGLTCIRNFASDLELVSQFFNFKVFRVTFSSAYYDLPSLPQQTHVLPNLNNDLQFSANLDVTVGSDVKVSSTQFDLNISASNQSFQIYVDNKLIESYTVAKVSPNVIEVAFESDKHFSEISVAFPNSTLTVNNETYPGNLTLRTPAYGEYYTKQQIETTQRLGEVTKAFKDLADNGKGGLILIGLALFFADFIEFVNIMTLYAFIDIARPSNLESIFRDWISSLQITPFPMFRIDMPLTEYDGLFARPEIFERYDFSFNILSSFIVFAAQIAFFVVLYEVLTWISQRLGNNKFGNIMRHRFGPAAYSNGMECYLSAAINFGFCGAAVLLDTRIVGVYKSLNFACAIFVVFLTGITAVAHPIFLKQTKKLKYMDTQDCYLSAQRLSYSSEIYVHSKVLMDSVIALSIPLTPPLVCLILLTTFGIIKLKILTKTEFEKKWIKTLKIIGLTFHCLLNVCFMVLFVANSCREEFSTQAYIMVGWVTIAFILFCLAVDVLILVAGITLQIPKWFRELLGSEAHKQNNKVTPKNEKKPRTSNRPNKITLKIPRSRKYAMDIIIEHPFVQNCLYSQPKQEINSSNEQPSIFSSQISKIQTQKKLSICFNQQEEKTHQIKIKTCRNRFI